MRRAVPDLPRKSKYVPLLTVDQKVCCSGNGWTPSLGASSRKWYTSEAIVNGIGWAVPRETHSLYLSKLASALLRWAPTAMR